jgi:hypothetical protein
MSSAKKLNVAPTLTHAEGMMTHAAIISPFWDALITGGLSVVVYLAACVFSPRAAPGPAIGAFVFNLSFAVNFPHFLASYQLLYGDFRHKITRDFRFMFAGLIVPIILAVGMAEASSAANPKVLGYFLVAMYFFVGWHYIKQTFGIMVVCNAYRKIFYNKSERFWLLTNMYAIWAVSFFSANANPSTYNQMGISYPSLNLTVYPLYASYALLGLGVAGNLFMHVKKYIREGSVLPASSIMGYLAIYVFLVPQFTHPFTGHTSPFFHSLQYLLFVFAYQRNKVDAEAENLPAIEARKKKVLGIGGFFFGSVVYGALAFSLVPGLFDHSSWLNRGLFGPTPFVLFATIFLNIHHYFIDNVIWKGSNREIREHLFRAS